MSGKGLLLHNFPGLFEVDKNTENLSVKTPDIFGLLCLTLFFFKRKSASLILYDSSGIISQEAPPLLP